MTIPFMEKSVSKIAARAEIDEEEDTESTTFFSEKSKRIYGKEFDYGSIEDMSDRYEKVPSPLAKALYTEDVLLSNRYFYSTVIIYLNVFVSEMSRGLLFPTLWLFVNSLGGSKSFQGLIVSSFSMGRIFTAPFFGYLSELYGHRIVLIICNVILIVGAVVYATSSSLDWLLAGQIILGIGGGK
jgi:Na+/melibiose symporter-like transporter